MLHALCTLRIRCYSALMKADLWRWQGVLAKAYITFYFKLLVLEIKAIQLGIYTCTALKLTTTDIPVPTTMSVNPPGGVNLTVAIFGLVGAAFSVVGFIAHYSPRRQYGDFCRVFRDINDIISDYDLCNNDSSELSLFQRSSLYRGYCRYVHYCSLVARVVSAEYNTVCLQI